MNKNGIPNNTVTNIVNPLVGKEIPKTSEEQAKNLKVNNTNSQFVSHSRVITQRTFTLSLSVMKKNIYFI